MWQVVSYSDPLRIVLQITMVKDKLHDTAGILHAF